MEADMSRVSIGKCIWFVAVLLLVLAAMPGLLAADRPAETNPLQKMYQTPDQSPVTSADVLPAEAQETMALSGGSGMTGVMVLSQGAIKIINGSTVTTSAPFLSGQMGSQGGGLFDVAITPNASTALISNFGDGKVFFVSLLNPAAPVVLGSVNIGFFAEDIAVTGDGKWALVSDGGFSSTLAVLNIATRRVVTVLNVTNVYSNAVAVSPDGQTVLTADYFSGRINVLKMNPSTGGLTYVKSLNILPYRPVNISISPDGRTALASNVGQYTLPPDPDQPPEPPNPDDFPANASIFRIDGPGKVYKTGEISLPAQVAGGQSIAFSRKGTRAFYSTDRFYGWEWVQDPDTLDWYWNPVYDYEIQILSVTGPGKVVPSGMSIRLPFHTTSQLFGVDTIAVDPLDNYLYVSNASLSGAVPYVAVVNLWTYRLVKFLDAGTYWDSGYMETMDNLPIGISFRENARPLTQIYP
jgi:DNA-binding beta-propeller fold protein YncE